MELLRRYFKERRQIDVLPECGEELRQTMKGVVQEVRAGKLGGDVDSMNRRVLSLMIPVVLQLVATPPPPPSPKRPFPAPVSMVIPEDPEKQALDKDQLFMERLKELEMTRSLPVASIAATGAATTTETVKSTMDLLLPSMNPVNLPTQIATVFMPTPPRRGQELWIQSWQRNWIQYPGRNGFSWAGPIPNGTDLTQTRVVNVFVPEVFHRLHKNPYLVLLLEGAGGQTAQVFLVPGADVGSGWRMYAPASADLGYLKPLACPWTVKLVSASGKMIEMGRDGETMVVSPSGEITRDPDDQWWLFGTQGAIYTWANGSWESGQAAAPPAGTEGLGLNFTRQWSVLLSIL
jgi:hypothetical protein